MLISCICQYPNVTRLQIIIIDQVHLIGLSNIQLYILWQSKKSFSDLLKRFILHFIR